MTDLHAQLEAWLVDGALGDPPREIAVHASVCEQCTTSLGAFDALALIDVGAAGSPPPLAAPTRLRVGMAWARGGAAVTGTIVAGILVVFGVSQLIGGVGPGGGAEGNELAGLSSASDRAAVETLQPSGGDSPLAEAATPAGVETPQPGVTPGPLPSLPPDATPRPPTPAPTAAPTPNATDTPAPTPAPTAAPTPTPEPTPTPPTPPPPLPQCSNLMDDDGDGATDWPADLECTGPLDDSELVL